MNDMNDFSPPSEAVGAVEMSTEVSELFAALAAAQGEIDDAKKQATNPHFKSKYADLEAVRAAYRGPLAKHGLALTQPPVMVNGRPGITTILAHKSGQWMRSTYALPASKQDAQGYGSAITYMRRYAAQAILGLASEDDDGNVASAQKTAAPAPAAAPPPTKSAKDKAAEWTENLVAELAGKDKRDKMTILGNHGLSHEENGALIVKKGTTLDKMKAHEGLFEKVTAAYFDSGEAK